MMVATTVGAQLKLKNLFTSLFAGLVSGLLIVTVAASVASADQTKSRRKKKQPAIPEWPSIPPKGDPSKPDFPPFPPSKPDWPGIPMPGDKPNPKGGPEVPFPLSTTLPFPWGFIEGVWRVEVANTQLLFSFTLENDNESHQYLRVIQIDHASGDLLAEGVGLRIEGDKLVRVAMMSKVDNSGSYMLFIGSYKNDSKASAPRVQDVAKSLTVLTVRSFADLMGTKDVQVIVTKISNTPYPAQKYLPKAGITN